MNEIAWTSHAEYKMKYYRLSKQKISGVIRRPDRIEKGIAGNQTIAVMQAVSPKIKDGKKVWNQEVWALYKEVSDEDFAEKKTGKSSVAEKKLSKYTSSLVASKEELLKKLQSLQRSQSQIQRQSLMKSHTQNRYTIVKTDFVQDPTDRVAQLKRNLLSVRKIRVISAWRYPGMSPADKPLPDTILSEIEASELE